MTPEQKPPAPAPVENSAPLGEAISIVPGSFDDESATPQVVGPTTPPAHDTPDTSAPAEHQTKHVDIAARAAEAESVIKDRTIMPPSASDKKTPITELINPSEWFKEDAPLISAKKTWYGKLMSRLLAHRRLFTAGVLVSICLIWGGVFSYIAVQHRQEKAGHETSLTAEQIQKVTNEAGANATGANQQGTDNPAATTADNPANNDTGNLVVSGSGDSNAAPPPAPSAIKQPQTYLVTFTSSCFTPSTITIKNGDIVTFKNNSNKKMWPASDPHPSHSAYPEFDPGQDIAPGSSWSFTFNKSGTWGYHDHNKPSCHGTVVVQ